MLKFEEHLSHLLVSKTNDLLLLGIMILLRESVAIIVLAEVPIMVVVAELVAVAVVAALRKCTYCGRINHTLDFCWKLYGKPAWANHATVDGDNSTPIFEE